jgi:MFS family permease
LFLAVFVAAAVARAVLVVANGVALAEDVDETRVSRGVASSAFSAAPDVANIGAPIVGGFVASIVTVGPMFAIMGVGFVASYAAGEVVVARWRAARRRAERSPIPVSHSAAT